MSEFIVSARKYRPMKFSEVVGQSHVTDTLKNAWISDHLAHAFLFCGPRGVGKTTCARILAKAINCENPTPDHEPCNECTSCQSINDNASFNIIEIDGASNNKVEHMHALIEQVRFQPQQGKYKVFIIDEVHMLSSSAFNAFLKTLEEPPPYAIFILATTEKHKIIPTILSRCQIYDFKRIGLKHMIAQLEHIAAEEGIETEKAALQIIASKADGALRDALSIFDRMASLSEDRIAYQTVIEHLNILDYDYYFRTVDSFLLEDLPAVLNLFHEVLGSGFEGDQFVFGLSAHMRDLLVCRHPDTIHLLEVGEDLRERYSQQADQVSNSFLMSALDLLNQCDIHYEKALNKRLHTEITLSRITYLNRLIKEGNTAKRHTAPEKKSADTREKLVRQPKKSSPPEKTTKTANVPVEKAPSKEKPKKGFSVPSIGKLDAIADQVIKTREEDKQNGLPLNPDNLQGLWDEYYQKIPSQAVRAYLRNIEFAINDRQVTIRTQSTLAKNALQQETRLLQTLRDRFKMANLSIQVEVDERLAPREEDQQKRLWTTKEKYDHLRDENPLVEKLVKTLQLRIDK